MTSLNTPIDAVADETTDKLTELTQLTELTEMTEMTDPVSSIRHPFSVRTDPRPQVNCQTISPRWNSARPKKPT